MLWGADGVHQHAPVCGGRVVSADFSDEARAEYERRSLIWGRVSAAAQEAAKRELGPIVSAEIEALAAGNKRGFFQTLMIWALEPLMGLER